MLAVVQCEAAPQERVAKTLGSLMAQEDLVDVEGTAASTHPLLTRYGDLRLTVDELQALAAAMVSGSAHFNVQHDPDMLWEASDVRAWVQEEGGYHYLRYRLRVPRRHYQAFRDQANAAGVPGGFSVTRTEAVRQFPEGASVGVIGDAADFSDAELVDLAELLGDRVLVSRLYQLGLEAEVIRFLLVVVVGGVTWDLIKLGVTRIVKRLASKAEASHRPVALDVQLHLPDGRTELRRAATLTGDGDVAAALNALQRIHEGE